MLIGATLRNRYKIIKLLGKGGFGDTYLAEDGDLPNHPPCVVKHFQPKSNKLAVLPIARRLFDREAEVLYKLGKNHDQIPTLFAHFEEQGEFYLVQEFIDGENLAQEIYAGCQLTETQSKKLIQEILEVLSFVHQQNIIHRDIKPQNLMRRRQDNKIILIDFGAVREISSLTINSQGQSSLTVIIGSPGYMPSEQAAGQPKLSSDVCAVGMLAIFALTGIRPHELPKDPITGEVIWRNWANISDEFAGFLAKMVRYHFGERHQSAGDALLALLLITLPPKSKPTANIQVPLPKLTASSHYSRRRLIQAIGFVGVGFGLAFIAERIFSLISGVLKTFDFEVVSVNYRGDIIKGDRHQAKYFLEDLGNGVNLPMVQIPGGNLTMGSPLDEVERAIDEESPQHQVIIPDFFMGKYEVTQAQYQAIMGTNPAQFIGANRPVEQITWDEAMEFCHKLSNKTSRTYRLPSEAEWEYACRGGTTTPFYFGKTITSNLANYDGNYTYAGEPKGKYRQETTLVGTFPPNPFGLYDMCGNVYEWCLDNYHQNYQQAPQDGSAWVNKNNPKNKNNDGGRILRGGSWKEPPRFCRSANRLWLDPSIKLAMVGFRVVLDTRKT
jgi:formylglycine-generating enzyme required for sulfatase activity/tRNA A-37 threonylcarbamoyl transferase component Bud32